VTAPFLAAIDLSALLTVLQILGSLGVFLFGMKVMSEAVQKVAGQKMRMALSTLTRNRFTGILTGLFTTGLVQSSSATTVLVVSFANAGLLTLVESIGVIMGANLGTTVTAWIVALVGKFDIALVALPVIGVGLPFLFIGRERGKQIGEILIGFGLIFFGLGLLKESVPDLRMLIKTDPGTAAMIQNIVTVIQGHGYGSIVMFLIAGLILTLLVQSSSAAMAITLTCALNGWLGDIDSNPLEVFRNSAAIVLGENIGTTVTAWMAALGASTNAKRAARAHFLFNVIGVGWLLVLFYPFTNWVWSLAALLPDSLGSVSGAMGKAEVGFATAIFHTSFNLANVLILVWFVPQIARVVEWWVKADPSEPKQARLTYISQNLVDLGELNLVEAENATVRMADMACGMFGGFIEVLEHPDSDMSERVSALKQMEADCDEMLHDITNYLIQCSSHEIGAGNAAAISANLRIVSEIEEATDRIYRLVKIIQRRYKKGREFLPEHDESLREFCALVLRFLNEARAGVASGVSNERLAAAEGIEDALDSMRKRFNKAAMHRMQEGGNVPTEMLYIEINNHLEAIGNHALNILQTRHQTHSFVA